MNNTKPRGSMNLFLSILLLVGFSFGENAYYRHHQQTTTAALEASLVNREVGIDASSRRSLIGKTSAGSLFHVISKEMDTATISGVLNVTGTATLTAAVTMSNYNSASIPFFGTAGLVTEDATNFTFNNTSDRLAVKKITIADSLILTANTASTPLYLSAGKVVTSGTFTGSGSTFVLQTSPTLVTPALGAATATSVSFGNEAVSLYDEGTFTLTGTGFTTSPTGTAKYTVFGKIVVLLIPEIYATSNSTSFTMTGLPAALQPVTIQHLPIMEATNNSAIQAGKASVDVRSSGTLIFMLSGDAAGWTSSNLKGNGIGGSVAQTITYTLQ